MKVLILPDRARAIDRVSGLLADQMRQNPASVLGLATGGTMEPVYAGLLEKAKGISFARATTFNLDEYVGLPGSHPQSYRQFMQKHLFDHIDLPPDHAHLPDGTAADVTAEALRYDRAIQEAGGLDLQLLGLGANGHIGFNEPTSSLGSRTRIKTLTAGTRADNARFFGPDEVVPKYAITMGIATICEARHIVLLATGPGKAAPARAMIEGPVSAACPGSALQYHPKVTVVLDQDAAADLTLREYYETVHPDGAESALDQPG